MLALFRCNYGGPGKKDRTKTCAPEIDGGLPARTKCRRAWVTQSGLRFQRLLLLGAVLKSHDHWTELPKLAGFPARPSLTNEGRRGFRKVLFPPFSAFRIPHMRNPPERDSSKEKGQRNTQIFFPLLSGKWARKLAKPKPATLSEPFLDQDGFDPGIRATLNGSGELVETAVPGMFGQHTPPSVSHALFFYPGNSESPACLIPSWKTPPSRCDW